MAKIIGKIKRCMGDRHTDMWSVELVDNPDKELIGMCSNILVPGDTVEFTSHWPGGTLNDFKRIKEAK